MVPGVMAEPTELIPPSLRAILDRRADVALPETAELEGLLGLGESLAHLRSEAQAREHCFTALIQALGAERGFLARRREEPAGWEIRAARTFDGDEIRNPDEKIIAELLDRAWEQRRGFHSPDLNGEAFAEQLWRRRQPRTRSVLLLPLPAANAILYFDHRFQSLRLEPDSWFRCAWLLTVLAWGEEVARTDEERQALDTELREARRTLRARRAPAPRAEHALAPATRGDPRGLRGDFREIVGESPEVLEILRLLEKISHTNASVLISGESGTGKELIARSIHKNSERATKPFVSENCAALAETLLETELFGHVKGAFTGATEDRPGLFELADGGTLFLDEIGDTSAGMQKKLLRALQEGVIRRVGGGDLIQVDVRVISASNKDLAAEVERGNFREDLYYRLNVINVALPALRDRLDDLSLLVDHFLEQLNRESGATKRYDAAFLVALRAHDWPGNVRELQNQVRRVYALSDELLDPAHLSRRVSRAADASSAAGISLERILSQGSLQEASEAMEREVIAACLKRFDGNKAQVCQHLGVPKTTLYAKLKRYGLRAP